MSSSPSTATASNPPPLPTTLRSRLLGAWTLISYSAHLPNDSSDKIYPMGDAATGIIMYASDGYMSAQLSAAGGRGPNQGIDPAVTANSTSSPSSSSSSSSSSSNVPPYAAYTGAFYLDESPGDEQGRPILMHEMRMSNLPRLLGDVQRRIVSITEEDDEAAGGSGAGTYLNLGLDDLMVIDGVGRVVKVRWKRLEDNSNGVKPPSR